MCKDPAWPMTTSKKARASKRGNPNRTAPTELLDLFLPFGIPPSPLHEVVQNAAIEAGWIPPWDNSVAKAKTQVTANQAAGKKSGQMRTGRANLRLIFVKAAYDSMKPSFRLEPFADDSLDELMKKYRFEITQTNDPIEQPKIAKKLMSAAPFKADRDTLKKDLLRLGIRSKRRKK
jgi:hypothetical protein